MIDLTQLQYQRSSEKDIRGSLTLDFNTPDKLLQKQVTTQED